jgi:hypothetical protein
MASARFHRPDSGLGLGEKARANIRSMRQLVDKMDIFTCAPHNDLLSDRAPNEAYCIANPGTEYAVFFTNGGDVQLNIEALKKPASLQWLNIMESRWMPSEKIEPQSPLTLRCPSQGYWAVLIQ